MTARETAFKTLGEFRRGKMRAEISYGVTSDESNMQASETALAAQIIKGVIQNLALCDYIASYFSSIELRKLQPHVLDILRISTYQILFLNKIPYSAAVNEGVKLAKKYTNPRATGFINALLRKIADSAVSGSLPEVLGDCEHQRLSIKYSHPEWLVQEYCKLLGPDNAEALLRENNSSNTPITAQINTLLKDTFAVASMLADDGVETKVHEWLENCVELSSPGRLVRLEAFKKGYIYIQDAASRMAIMAAAPKPGDIVIDACAAPGGKSFAAAILMKNKGRIVACDISAEKLKHIKDGSMRLGISIIEAIEKDAAEQDSGFWEIADVVLADVPCSGFGVIRKKPDIRYKSQQSISGLADIQKKILFNLSSYVKPGGTLLYSTCTIFKQENEDVVEAFLRERNEFSAEGFYLPCVGNITDGMVTLWPHTHGTDGFFICKLRRRRKS